jgi:GntR family transcriptional regulator/MocR family aminotransferase
MRTEYRARLDALTEAAARHCGGLLRLRPVATGLHAVAEIDVADDTVVFREATARGVEVMPLSNFYFDRRSSPVRGVMLGFAAVRPELIDAGMERLAAAIEAARRRPRSGRIRSS